MAKSLMIPDYKFERVFLIKKEFLKNLNLSCLIIDIDNTLALADDKDPQPGVSDWVNMLKDNDFNIIFLSNNTKSRVKPFAEIYDVPYIHMALKPLVINFNKAVKTFNKPKNEIAIIGDQIFTDVVGGNLTKITTILVEPFEPKTEGGFFFRIKRRLERRYISKYDSLHKGDEKKDD